MPAVHRAAEPGPGHQGGRDVPQFWGDGAVGEDVRGQRQPHQLRVPQVPPGLRQHPRLLQRRDEEGGVRLGEGLSPGLQERRVVGGGWGQGEARARGGGGQLVLPPR